LIHSWRGEEKKRVYTKPFLLILILLYYLASTDVRSTSLILALATSWRDVLLIPKGHGWFTAGGISFMFTHFFLVLVYSQRIVFDSISWIVVIPAAALYCGVSGIVIYNLKPTTPKMMVIPMYFYLICNSTMNVFALMLFVSLK